MLAENGLKALLLPHGSRVAVWDYVPSWEFNSLEVGRLVVKKIRTYRQYNRLS